MGGGIEMTTAQASARSHSIASVRNRYTSISRNSARFQGEPGFVAYYWHLFMSGTAEWVDDDNNTRTIGFRVTKIEKQIFPELSGTDFIYLFEDDMGSVHRTNWPSEYDFELELD